MTNTTHLPAYVRGIAHNQQSFKRAEATPVSPALVKTTEGAVKQLRQNMRFLSNAGAVGQVVTAVQEQSTPAPMRENTDRAPGEVTNQSSLRTGEGTAPSQTRIAGVNLPPIRSFVAGLPPIVGKPLKWGVPIGIGLYALGHHKAGVVCIVAGAARWALYRGYLGNV